MPTLQKFFSPEKRNASRFPARARPRSFTARSDSASHLRTGVYSWKSGRAHAESIHRARARPTFRKREFLRIVAILLWILGVNHEGLLQRFRMQNLNGTAVITWKAGYHKQVSQDSHGTCGAFIFSPISVEIHQFRNSRNSDTYGAMIQINEDLLYSMQWQMFLAFVPYNSPTHNSL